jgi:hypothetical protein
MTHTNESGGCGGGGLGCEPSGCGFCLDTSLETENVPSHIRAQVFTSNNATGSPFNQGAIFRRDAAPGFFPLAHSSLAHSKKVGQGGLRSDDLGGFIKCFHTTSFRN